MAKARLKDIEAKYPLMEEECILTRYESFLRACLTRELPLSIQTQYMSRFGGKSEEEKEALAIRLAQEIEAKYPLREEKTNSR